MRSDEDESQLESIGRKKLNHHRSLLKMFKRGTE